MEFTWEFKLAWNLLLQMNNGSYAGRHIHNRDHPIIYYDGLDKPNVGNIKFEKYTAIMVNKWFQFTQQNIPFCNPFEYRC